MPFNTNNINKEALLILYTDSAGKFQIDYFPIQIDTRITEEFSKLKENLKKTSNDAFLTSLQKYNLKTKMIIDYWNNIKKNNQNLFGYRSYCYAIASSLVSPPTPIHWNSTLEVLPYVVNSDIVELKLDNFPIQLESIFSSHFFESHFIEEAYRECNSQANIKAYSHRRLGWNSEKFKLNDEFQIEINTNFGYGYANYFCVTLIYDGIQVIPYSRLVKYYYANFSQLIRHTWEFRIKEENWHLAFTMVSEACNGYKTYDKNNFIKKYFVYELENLTSLLKESLTKNEFLLSENLYGTFSENNDYKLKSVRLQGLELTDFRSEKVSGAIGFIDSILKISKLFPIERYIKIIEECSKRIFPEIENAIIQTGNIINELEKSYQIEIEKKAIIDKDYQDYFPIWEELSKIENERFDIILELNNVKKNVKSDQYLNLEEFTKTQMNIDYPDWPQINELLKVKSKACTDQTRICYNIDFMISKNKSNLNTLKNRQKIIFDYIESVSIKNKQ